MPAQSAQHQHQRTRYQAQAQRRTDHQSSVYYSPDSSARQLQEQTMPLPTPRPVPRGRTSHKRKRGFATDIQARHRHNFLSYALVLVFFGCVAIVVTTNARLTYSHSALEDARAQLVGLQSDNAVMEGAIIASLDFAEIERVAIYELGMAPAEEFQYFVVNVQPRSFLTHSGTQEDVRNSGWTFDRFRHVILNLTGGN